MKLSRLLGIALGAACLLLLVVAGLVASGIVTGVDPGANRVAVADRPVAELETGPIFELPELEEFAAITERPLFNESRRPEIKEPALLTDEGEEEEVATAPLDISVRGIIITPDVKLALLTDNRTKESMRLREGMPLEGEMAGWTLTEIQPRKLVFDGDSLGQAEVELQVHDKALASAPTPAVRPSSPAGEEPAAAEEAPAAGNGENQAALQSAEARAEEIRRRVAERREQLRAEAERRRQLQQAEEQ